MTRRDTFTNLSDVWTKEVDLYSTNQDCVKMLVGNKVDKVSFPPWSKRMNKLTEDYNKSLIQGHFRPVELIFKNRLFYPCPGAV